MSKKIKFTLICTVSVALIAAAGLLFPHGTVSDGDRTVGLTIECFTALENAEQLSGIDAASLPSDGVMLDAEIHVNDGDTVFDALETAARLYGIRLDYQNGGTVYIRAINDLAEFSCGSGSGWMYFVNGEYTLLACSQYELHGGEQIVFSYTCALGADLEYSQKEQSN